MSSANQHGFEQHESNYTALTIDADPAAEFWCRVLDMPDDDYPTLLATVLFEVRPSNRRFSIRPLQRKRA